MPDAPFPFGTQYLRGFFPDPARWARDLDAMRQLGFNTIRVWLVWGVLEPAPGRIDYAYLDRILGLAAERELRTILLFHLHGCPEWAVRRHRECWYVDRHGAPFEPSTRPNTPSGGWPGLCPDHPEVQALEAGFIRAVCRHAGDRAYAYEPINEPHAWVDIARVPQEDFCYCPATRAAFVGWLRARYGTLERLEDAWGRRLDEWDSARPPTWNFGFADHVDWRRFMMDNVAGLVARRTAAIRENSSAPVIGHARGGGSTACTRAGRHGLRRLEKRGAPGHLGLQRLPRPRLRRLRHRPEHRHDARRGGRQGILAG